MGDVLRAESAVVHIAPGIYVGKLTKKEEVTWKDEQSKESKMLFKLFWEVKVGDKAVVLSELSDMRLTRKNKMAKIFQALTGQDIELGQNYDINSILGRTCNLVVEDKITRDGEKASKIANHVRISDGLSQPV